MSSYPKHDATLKWAIAEIGVREVPKESNTGPRVCFYQRHTWLGGTGWAWCVAFALSATEEGGGFKFPEPSAGAWDLLRRCEKKGWSKSPSNYKIVRPGDLVIFAVGSGHAAVVESIEETLDGIVIHSVDGNADDQVKRCTRYLKDVKGFICWPETPVASAPPKKDAKAPLVSVVGGASGRRAVVTRGGKVVKLPSVKIT